jgi:hypothetical protein
VQGYQNETCKDTPILRCDLLVTPACHAAAVLPFWQVISAQAAGAAVPGGGLAVHLIVMAMLAALLLVGSHAGGLYLHGSGGGMHITSPYISVDYIY